MIRYAFEVAGVATYEISFEPNGEQAPLEQAQDILINTLGHLADNRHVKVGTFHGTAHAGIQRIEWVGDFVWRPARARGEWVAWSDNREWQTRSKDGRFKR